MTFTATVSPQNASQDVEWSIDEGATAAEAAVSADGVFSAGNVPGTAVLRATSKQDKTKIRYCYYKRKCRHSPDN